MSRRWTWAAVAAITMLVATAGRSSSGETPTDGSGDDAPSPAPSAAGDVEFETMSLGGTEADVFPPPDGADDSSPIVVMLHGTLGDRTRMHALAGAVAAGGSLVYVPTWPAIDLLDPDPARDSGEAYRIQSEIVVCTLRAIRGQVDERGGDPDDLTVVGHSGGAMIGARIALVDDPPWTGIDCDPDIPHRPDRFVGLAGDYPGRYQRAGRESEDYEPFDLFTLEPTNPELDVWLIHGNNDQITSVYETDAFADLVAEHGYPSQMITTDLGHDDQLEAGHPGLSFTADQISAIVHGELVPQQGQENLEASLRFDTDEVCSYTGPTTMDPGDILAIALDNATDVDIMFALVSVLPDAGVSDDELLQGDGELGVDNPDWVEWGGFVEVAPGEAKTLRFAMVEADQQFVVYCHTVPDTDHPRPNWMYPAAVLTPSGDV